MLRKIEKNRRKYVCHQLTMSTAQMRTIRRTRGRRDVSKTHSRRRPAVIASTKVWNFNLEKNLFMLNYLINVTAPIPRFGEPEQLSITNKLFQKLNRLQIK